MFFIHSILGAGAPVNGISILMGSPARTLILLPMIPSSHNFGFSEKQPNKCSIGLKIIDHLPFIGLAIKTLDVSLGLPFPAALTAEILYSY